MKSLMVTSRRRFGCLLWAKSVLSRGKRPSNKTKSRKEGVMWANGIAGVGGGWLVRLKYSLWKASEASPFDCRIRSKFPGRDSGSCGHLFFISSLLPYTPMASRGCLSEGIFWSQQCTWFTQEESQECWGIDTLVKNNPQPLMHGNWWINAFSSPSRGTTLGHVYSLPLW